MKEQPRRRAWYWAGAVGAAIVATIFATVGDGVDVQAPGWRGLVADLAHTAVWMLLAGACAVAGLQGRWSRTSGVLATAALALYVVFLIVVLAG
jgi:peptidoglycan/LPS O-acetylase OafA/YrhL